MSSDPTVEEIKSRLSLPEFVQEYVPLKRAGANWKGLCPFHHEKTPSFMVHADRGFWHCFGCSEGGDAFTFLQKIEGLEFPEALRFLAERTGVQLPERHAREVEKSQRERLRKILALSATFYHRILIDSPKAETARSYLGGRRLAPTSIEKFSIGFAPPAWDTLLNFLTKRGFGVNDVHAAGLVVRNDRGGFYDRFRDRIMFPIADAHGEVVGFTGRQLHESGDAGGKYVNTSQTALFDKSKLLYGLHLAKTTARKEDFLVIVEGQMDVISSHEAGVENVVASSGTAFTEAQVALIARYTKNIRIAFDADRAGEAATRRGVTLALMRGLGIDVITLKGEWGKDPDECARKDPALWRAAVEAARPFIEVAIERETRRTTTAGAREKRTVAETLLPLIHALTSSVEQDHWIRKLAAAIDASPQALYDDLRRLGARAAPSGEAPHATAATPPKDMRAQLSEDIVALLTLDPQLLQHSPPDIEAYLTPPVFHTLYIRLKNAYNKDALMQENSPARGHSVASEGTSSDQDLKRQQATLEMRAAREYAGLTREERVLTMGQMATRLKDEWRKETRRKLSQAIAAAEARGDTSALRVLLGELRATS